MMSAAGTTAMLSVMPKDLAMSLMSLSFSSSWMARVSFVGWVIAVALVGLGRRRESLAG